MGFLRSHKPRHRHGMVSVATVQGMLLAQVLKSKLEAFGVPCALDYESYGQVLGVTVDGLGAVDLMVPEAQAELALRLIDPRETEPLGEEDELPIDDLEPIDPEPPPSDDSDSPAPTQAA
jgi:hypothetical protein